MTEKPAFSVAIPAMGQAEFVSTALESIKAQKAAVNLSVLDATADGSVQNALAPYGGMIAYRYHHPDGGQAVAIQEGWNNTGGSIVSWLNADDYLFPGALEEVGRVFEAEPDTDVVFGHGVYVYPDCGFMMYFPAINPDVSRLAKGSVIHQPSCFVRRAAMEKVGGLDASLKYTMDWDFWIRLQRAGCVFRFLDKPLSAARIYPETKTLRGSDRRYREMASLLEPSTGPIGRALFSLKYRAFDAVSREEGFFSRAVSMAGAAAIAAKDWLAPGDRIYGLGRWSNMVQDRCQVFLPWFSANAPLEMVAEFSSGAKVSISVNGHALETSAAPSHSVRFLGREMAADAVSARLPSTGVGVLEFEIRSNAGKFRLYSLRVR